MPDRATVELALIDALSSPAPVISLAPSTAPAPASTKAALRRCRAAWQRAFNEYMKTSDGTGVDKMFAAKDGAKAYCTAMPLLAGYEGIRDFIACAAYGILIDAIPADRSGQLLYAAQVALSTLPRDAKPGKS